MSLEQCTCSPESVADYSQTSFSDISQLSLWSGSLMPAESSENALPKDGSPACTCGKAMSGCSIHPNTREAWIASMQDSLAKTLALLESRQVYLKEPDQVFTEKSCVLLTRYDRNSSSWRTLQQSFLTDSEPFSETWPRWGMMLDGAAYVHPMSERRITETDGFYWPTPRAQEPGRTTEGYGRGLAELVEGKTQRKAIAMWPTPRANSAMASTITPENSWNADRFPNLETVVGLTMWPKPTAHNAKECNAKSESQRNTPTLAAQAGGKLNPDWVGWLMAFPIGWANSKDTAMPKSRCKPQQLSSSCTDKEAA